MIEWMTKLKGSTRHPEIQAMAQDPYKSQEMDGTRTQKVRLYNDD